MPAFAEYQPEVHGTRDRTVLVRPATPSDAPVVVAVAATRWAQPSGQVDRVIEWTGDAARLVLVAAAPVAHGLAGGGPAQIAARVVGWAMLARWRPDDAPHGWYVSALTVSPARRRCGLGARLLAGLLGWEPARGHAVRSVVNATNLASIALHERHGFREVARGPSFAGITFTGGSGVLLHHGDEEERT